VSNDDLMSIERSRMIGCLQVLAAATIWGSNGVIVNLIPLPSYVIAFFRVALGTVAISVGILFSKRTSLFKPSYSIKKLFVLGVMLSLGWVLLFEAMKLLPIAEAVLLNYTAPIFVAILAVKFLKEKITGRITFSLILSFIGIVLIVISNGIFVGINFLGAIVGLSAGLSYAVFVVLSKDALHSVPNYTLVVYANFFAAIVLSPSMLGIQTSLSFNVWILILILAIFNTAFAVSLYYGGLKKIRAQEAAILAYLEPVSATMFGFVFLKQTPTMTVIVGGILILLGGYIVTSQHAISTK
jgi:drug/metabolite transporter (DMT)-like permease